MDFKLDRAWVLEGVITLQEKKRDLNRKKKKAEKNKKNTWVNSNAKKELKRARITIED